MLFFALALLDWLLLTALLGGYTNATGGYVKYILVAVVSRGFCKVPVVYRNIKIFVKFVVSIIINQEFRLHMFANGHNYIDEEND